MSNEVITTVLTAASTYDLTDIATAKLELGDTGTADDVFIARSISQVSKAAANYCNRVFPVETLTDLIYVDRNVLRTSDLTILQLSRCPLVRIASVIENAGLSDETTLVSGTDYQIKAEDGQLLRLDSTAGCLMRWCARTVTVQYSAGYGAQVSQTATIPATPFQVTVTNGATFALDLGVLYGSTAFVAVANSPAAGQYSVSAAGVYTFNTADTAKSVAITYLYTDIPDDLAEACLRMITARFKAKGRDPTLVSEESPGVGSQRWWVGVAPGQSSSFPPEIAALLDPYCIPTVG